MKPTTLYRYFDANGDLLYIGISGRPINRASEHRWWSKWWPDIASATYEHFADRAEAEAAEAAAIVDENPKHNVLGTPPEIYRQRRGRKLRQPQPRPPTPPPFDRSDYPKIDWDEPILLDDDEPGTPWVKQTGRAK